MSIFRCASIFNTYPGTSVRKSVRYTFGIPFCQRLSALTKRQDDIVVANMVADKVADMTTDMELDMVAVMEVDKVADVADMF